jgi:hypothetical protein
VLRLDAAKIPQFHHYSWTRRTDELDRLGTDLGTLRSEQGFVRDLCYLPGRVGVQRNCEYHHQRDQVGDDLQCIRDLRRSFRIAASRDSRTPSDLVVVSTAMRDDICSIINTHWFKFSVRTVAGTRRTNLSSGARVLAQEIECKAPDEFNWLTTGQGREQQ